MIAFSVLLIVLLPMVFLMSELGAQTNSNRLSITAGQLAEQALENAGSLPLTGSGGLLAALGGGITTNPVVDGVTYNSVVQLSWSTIGSTKNLCTSGSPPQVILATAVVTWNGGGGGVTENTAINPPYGALVATDGFVPVEVTGAKNQPMPNINVTVNDISTPASSAWTGTTTYKTDATGCAFIQVPGGDKYSFALGPPTGYSGYSYVSSSETPSPISSMGSPVGLNGTVSTLISFNYDISGSVGLTSPSVTAVDGGVLCPTTATCFAMGQSATSATLFASTAASGWTNVSMPVSNTPTLLSAVACPSASQCYFVGSRATVVSGSPVSAGIILSAALSGTTWTLTNATLNPASGLTATSFTSISCPSATLCFASGNGISGATQQGILASATGAFPGTWATASPTVSPATTTLSSLPSIACPTTTLCLAVGSGVNTSGGTGVAAPTVFNYTVSTKVLKVVTPVISGSVLSAASIVTCPTIASTTCFVTGSSITSPAITSVPTMYVSTNEGTSWTQTILTGALTVGPMTCSSSSLCFAPTTMSSGGNGAGDISTIFRLAFTVASSPAAWTAAQQTTPASFTGSVAAVTCPSTTACLTAGQSGTSGFVDNSTGTVATVGTTWSAVTLTATQTPGYFSGIACIVSGTYCVAAGEGPSGDLLDSSTNSGTAWSAAASTLFTPNGGGQSSLGLPISYTAPGTSVVSTPLPASGQAGQAPPTQVASLYPFPTAYTLFYGDCTSEKLAGSTASATVSSSTIAHTAIGLGTLAVKVLDQNGQPITGAEVSVLTSDSTCPIDAFTLPASGAAGVSQAGIINTPIGIVTPFAPLPYTLTVTSGAHTFPATTLVVSNSGVVATSGGVSIYYHYPNPVVIKALT